MAVSNSLTKSAGQQKLGISAYLTQDAIKNQINNVIGGKDGTKFIASVVSAVTANPALQECTNQSILAAALLGESLNLSPSPQLGQYYMVPYDDKNKGTVAQFQLGYKGYIQLAIRSGQYKKLNVLAIKKGELVKFDPLNEEIEVNLIEDEDEREQAETVGYYAMYEYLNGFRKAIYWSKKKMINHADKYSKAFSKNGGTVKGKFGEKKRVSYEEFLKGSYDPKDAWMYSSNWYQNFDDMAFKTMIRQLIGKWGVMSVEFQTAFEADMAVINEDGSKVYVDNDNTIDSEYVEVPATDVAAEEQPKTEAPADDISNAFFN